MFNEEKTCSCCSKDIPKDQDSIVVCNACEEDMSEHEEKNIETINKLQGLLSQAKEIVQNCTNGKLGDLIKTREFLEKIALIEKENQGG